MQNYIPRYLSISALEAENRILDFAKSHHTLAEIEEFQKELLAQSHYKAVKKLINQELKRIISKVKDGMYNAPPELVIEIKSPKHNTKVQSNKTLKNGVKVYTAEVPIVKCNYMEFTIKEFSESLQISVTNLIKIIRSKNKLITIDIDKKITETEWKLIEDFALNKINLLIRHFNYDPKKQDTDLKVRNRKYQASILQKFYGGNFYKIIYTGMIN